MTSTPVVVLAQASLYREAWMSLLSSHPAIAVVGGASGPDELARLSLPMSGGSVLLDAEAETASEVIRRLARLGQGWSPLVLVDAYEVPHIVELMRAGALGVIARNSLVPELVSGLAACARGELVLPGPLASEVLTQLMGDPDVRSNGPSPLSSRETEVLHYLAQGMTNKNIAQALYLSVRTVEAHLRAIYGKLGVTSRTEAVLWAVRHGDSRRE